MNIFLMALEAASIFEFLWHHSIIKGRERKGKQKIMPWNQKSPLEEVMVLDPRM